LPLILLPRQLVSRPIGHATPSRLAEDIVCPPAGCSTLPVHTGSPPHAAWTGRGGGVRASRRPLCRRNRRHCVRTAIPVDDQSFGAPQELDKHWPWRASRRRGSAPSGGWPPTAGPSPQSHARLLEKVAALAEVDGDAEASDCGRRPLRVCRHAPAQPCRGGGWWTSPAPRRTPG